MLSSTHLLGVLVLAVALLAILGCEPPAQSDSIKLDGSRLMLRVTKAWAEKLESRPSPLKVEVGESGSTEAIQKLMAGQIDVATASRHIRNDELVDARSRGVKIEGSCIGFLMYSVIVHPSNQVSDLTTDQVSDIFSGKIKEWAQVGGAKQPITRVYRRVKPGEYDHFFERVVKGEPSETGTVVLDMPEQIGEKVASDLLSIGYLLTGDLPKSGVRIVPIRRNRTSPPTEPTVDAALAGQYPLLRPLYLYINRSSPRPAGYFRDFVLGEEGREIAKANGMAPLPQKSPGEVDSIKLFEMLSW